MKLIFKSPEIVARAVKAGLTVHWFNNRYTVTADMRITRCDGSIEDLRWPTHDVADFFVNVSQDTEDFLATFLFCNEPDTADGAQPTVYDFAPEFIAAVEEFIAGFRDYLELYDLDLDLDTISRSFGGNVYLSLSGHGAGFWDDSDPMWQKVHDNLVAYSGSEYRFEQLDVCNDESGLLDLSILPEYRQGYRDKMFEAP